MRSQIVQRLRCPFIVGDIVKCQHTNVIAIVDAIDFDLVWCVQETGKHFYRTWTHDLDTIMYKSGGGLTLIKKWEPPNEPEPETSSAALSE